jgi:hypothetical protein
MKMLPDEENEEDEGSEGEDSMEEDSIAPQNEIPIEEMISPTSSWSMSSTGTLAFLLLHMPSYRGPWLLSLPFKKTHNYITKIPPSLDSHYSPQMSASSSFLPLFRLPLTLKCEPSAITR